MKIVISYYVHSMEYSSDDDVVFISQTPLEIQENRKILDRQSWLRALALIASKKFDNPLNKQLWCKLAPLNTNLLAVQILWQSPSNLKYEHLAPLLRTGMEEWQAGTSHALQKTLDKIADDLEGKKVPSYRSVWHP
jgi:hypothetical protein